MVSNSSINDKHRQSVRLFVSSTFLDMQDERNELIKYVFPKLRQLCESRGVSWTSVDLRWGITDEQKAEGNVLSLCFAEIERCRPYFIGILAGRYGWVPDNTDALSELCHSCAINSAGRSVTELEFEHGILNHPSPKTRAFFYSRMPNSQSVGMHSKSGKRRDSNLIEDERLTTLKNRIRSSDLQFRENYSNARELGEWVLEDLSHALEQDFPDNDTANDSTQETFAHDAFSTTRTSFYIARDPLFEVLDAFVTSDDPPMVISGGSGIGKSSLLSAWSNRLIARTPEVSIIRHFIGSTSRSNDWHNILNRLVSALNEVLGEATTTSDSPEHLRLKFAENMARLDSKRCVVIIIDGLDQLIDYDGALDLAWLPESIPTPVRLILSTSDGHTLNVLKKRNCRIQQVDELSSSEIREMTVKFLGAYGKSLSDALLEKLAENDQTRNSLFLRVILEELRIHGEYTEINDLLTNYLNTGSIEALLDQLLSRYEKDYERDRAGLVGEAMSLLWGARRGLSEDELLDLLGQDGDRLPSASWSPLALASTFALTEHSGLLTLFHRHLRTVVAARYLSNQSAKANIHNRIANYFICRDSGPRQLEELPWQLSAAENWEDLVTYLTKPEFFDALWQRNPSEVQRYWIQIEAHTKHRIPDSYTVNDPQLTMVSAHNISHFLKNTGYGETALQFTDLIIDYYRGKEPDKLAMTLAVKGITLTDMGDFDKAAQVFDDAQVIAEDIVAKDANDTDVLATVLTSRTHIPLAMGHHHEAITLHKQVEKLMAAKGNSLEVAESLCQQAFLYRQIDDTDQASALLARAKNIYRDHANLEGLAGVIDEQAKLALAIDDDESALSCLREEVRLYQQLNQPIWVATCLGQQGRILAKRGDFDAASQLFVEEQKIHERDGNTAMLCHSLTNESQALASKGDIAAGLERLEHAERLCRGLGTPDILAQNLTQQAQHRIELNDLDYALALLIEEEAIYREEWTNDLGLASNLLSQADVHERRKEHAKALQLLREGEILCRKTSDNLLFQNLWAQNNVLIMISSDAKMPQGKYEVMVRVANEASQLASKLGYPDIAESLETQAKRSMQLVELIRKLPSDRKSSE